jgi:hypothetical protein
MQSLIMGIDDVDTNPAVPTPATTPTPNPTPTPGTSTPVNPTADKLKNFFEATAIPKVPNYITVGLTVTGLAIIGIIAGTKLKK